MAKSIDVNALPEKVVSSADFVEIARRALSARSSRAQYEKVEESTKDELAIKAIALREAEAATDNYIGLVRVVKPDTDTADMQPVQVQFKMTGKKKPDANGKRGAFLLIEDLPVLDELFGANRPVLWEPTKIVTAVVPDTLLESMKAANLNPWDYLELKVKDGMDHIVARHAGATSTEVVAPKEGFLARLQDFGRNLCDEAKEYVREYLKEALSTAVNVGSKGKA
jgi:hypothetical protein